MDELDREILEKIQTEFPCVPEPFKYLGEHFVVSSAEILRRIQQLKTVQLLRQISAIFDAPSLGYQTALVAMELEEDRIDHAAQIINRHPGVSHNYQRDAEYNLWFTIAVRPGDSLDETVILFARQAEAFRTLILPAEKMYKIRAKFKMSEMSVDSDAEGKTPVGARSPRPKLGGVTPPLPSTMEISAIRVLQEDLPLIDRPFEALAEEVGISEPEILDIIKNLKAGGYLRRFAGLLHHRNAGFNANAMVVWAVPENRTDEAGRKMADCQSVTHCYKRPAFSDWPYSIYTMVHGSDLEDCKRVIGDLAQEAGDWPRKILYSIKEYKKTRLKLFSDEFDQWSKAIHREEAVHA